LENTISLGISSMTIVNVCW